MAHGKLVAPTTYKGAQEASLSAKRSSSARKRVLRFIEELVSVDPSLSRVR